MRSVILLALLMFSSIVYGAISITTPPGALPDGSAFPANSYNFTFTGTTDAPPLTWQLKLGDVLPTGLTLSSSGNITGTPDISTAGKTFTFHVQVANANSEVAEAQFSITITRLPVDVMLVLDNSASMECCYDKTPPDPTCVSCATATNSRMARLKVAVDKFFTLGTAGMKPYFHTSNADPQFNDRFGAVIFCGGLDASHSSYAGNTPTTLNTFIQMLTTCGGTCIGGGLLSGISNMKSQSATNHNKSLILFTDGEQNYNPMLKDAGGAPVKYEAGDLPIHPYDPKAPNPPYGSCMPFPATTPVFDNNFRNTDPAIKVSTIGFELPAGPGNQLLADLADPINGAGGTTNISGGMGAGFDDFGTFFTNAFAELLSGSSPQIVREKYGVTASGTNRISFFVNDTVTKVSFILSGNTGAGDTLQFRVMKDSADVTRLGTMIHRNSYNLWNLDIPFKPSEGVPHNFKVGGEWVLQTTQVPNIRYVATCIVDDHLLDYKCSFGGSSAHVVGSPIPLKVTLTWKNKPLKDSARVMVLVQRTTDDGGTQLALLPVPQQLKTLLESTTVDPGYNNLGELKHYTLLQTEQKYRQTLTPTVDTVVLTNNGDGSWSGSYDPKVTGVYKFTYLIDGKDSMIGTFQRSVVRSSVVSLSHFDLSPGNIKLEEVNENGQLTGYKITLIIKDSSGLLKGPAFGSSLGLQSNTGKFGPVTDNLDGSYTFVLTLDNNDKNPNIDITVGGKHYYSGPVNSLGSSGGGGASLFGHWWFWLILLLILILIILALRKKKP